MHRRSQHLLVSDIDNTLIGNAQGLNLLLEQLQQHQVMLGLATGRSFESALEALQEWQIPMPDVLITSVGSEIYYAGIRDADWSWHIDHAWQPDGIRQAMARLPGIELQPDSSQRRHKISYFVDVEVAPTLEQIVAHLRQQGLSCTPIFSHKRYLDLLPLRASKGKAVRYCLDRWGFDDHQVLVAGDSGNDAEMLAESTLAVVVGNYSPELEPLRGRPDIHFANGTYAWGILEGMAHFQFLSAAASNF